MSLRHATFDGQPLDLPGEPPYAATLLQPWAGKQVWLPCDDPWVRGSGDEAHAYLDGARSSWTDHPEYMDFLDVRSPVHDLKQAETDLYLHHWRSHLGAQRVLDVGCGVGRLAVRWLDRGASVVGLDPDLESLRRLMWHAAGSKGSLDLHWSSAHTLPDVQVDLVVCAEVLCYVPDAVGALKQAASRLAPGGRVLLSVEARWAWAASQDVPSNTIDVALGGSDGVIARSGDRWVQTYTEDTVRALVRDAGLTVEDVVPSHWVPDGPLEGCSPDSLSLEELVALEAACRAHPVWGPLHRLWLVTAHR
ncbi:MAG: class I SAM-dependent methyltransferase [Myxococcales bacterium]|nr:class I SAM-dependent methyltransferase [Myxococcales bacterium]